jgi:hypothetical protein
MNHVTLAGYAVSTPQLSVPGGTLFARFFLATLREPTPADPALVGTFDLHLVVAFGELARQLADLKAHQPIRVEGLLTTYPAQHLGFLLLASQVEVTALERNPQGLPGKPPDSLPELEEISFEAPPPVQ